jgi:MYXO-CTERM domain-containing protein
MIDSGTDVGLPFSGSAPDIGFFESGGTDRCAAPSGGASGSAGSGANASTEAGDDGGCGCRAGDGSPGRGAWLLLGSLLALGGLRRRWRHAGEPKNFPQEP